MKCTGQTMSSIVSSKLNPKTGYHIYKTTSVPTTLYCSEIWGLYHSSKKFDRTRVTADKTNPLETYYTDRQFEINHRKFLRFLLGTSTYSCNLSLYCEMGAKPLYSQIFKSALLFWFHILSSPENSLLKLAYKNDKELASNNSTLNWSLNFKRMLNYYGFGHLWDNQGTINVNKTVFAFSKKLDHEFQAITKNFFTNNFFTKNFFTKNFLRKTSFRNKNIRILRRQAR